MKVAITLFSALLLQLGGDPAGPPDLCQVDPLRDPAGVMFEDTNGTNLSRYCEWTGPDVPAWNDLTCCTLDEDGASCVSPSSRGDCGKSFDPYYCEYGEEQPGGGFVCYQSFPDACAHVGCTPGTPDLQAPNYVQEAAVCCTLGGACANWFEMDPWECPGEYFWCHAGMTNQDGTTDCWDASTEP